MTLSMAAFALEDLFVKRAVRALPLSEVLVLCGLGGALVFAGLAWGQGVRLLQPAALSRLMAGRAVFELVGRLFYALAIALTPLSSATAILQATPVLVVRSIGPRVCSFNPSTEAPCIPVFTCDMVATPSSNPNGAAFSASATADSVRAASPSSPALILFIDVTPLPVDNRENDTKLRLLSNRAKSPVLGGLMACIGIPAV